MKEKKFITEDEYWSVSGYLRRTNVDTANYFDYLRETFNANYGYDGKQHIYKLYNADEIVNVLLSTGWTLNQYQEAVREFGFDNPRAYYFILEKGKMKPIKDIQTYIAEFVTNSK